MEAHWKHWMNSRQLSTNRSSAGGHLVVSQRRNLNNKLAKFKDFGCLWTCSQNFLSQISNENHMYKWAVLLKIWHIYITIFTSWSFLFLLLSSLICYKWSYPLTCWHSFCGQYLVYAVSLYVLCVEEPFVPDVQCGPGQILRNSRCVCVPRESCL